jgi:transcription elongation factor SPT5
MDVREIVRGIKERHGRSSAAKYDADSDNIPQRLLMPSSEDPSLWRVRVKVSLPSP